LAVFDGFYILLVFLGVPAVVLIAVAWGHKGRLFKLGRPSYEGLLAEKARLHECVVDWRYPDGTFVPQHKRQRMFKDLRRLSDKIRRHPGNPENQSPPAG
jgi:hypothetical protein